MLNRTTLWVACLAVCLAAVNSGCRQGPSRVYPPAINASAAGKEAIAMFDTNKDQKLDGAELDKCPGLKSAAARLDPTGMGITAEMITARIKVWQDSRLGRTVFSCRVMRNGQPVPGVDVKLVPEKFLGPNMLVASGKTSEQGMAMLSVPVKEREGPGVPPGFYRVEITSPTIKIPVTYNTQTILGQEIANGVGTLQPPTYDLRF